VPLNPLLRIALTELPEHREPLDLNATHRSDAGTPTWKNRAACRGKTNLMFPLDHKDITYIRTARGICRECPVRAECLEYALEFPANDLSGVWAGLTPRQLSAEQRRRGLPPKRPSIAAIWKELR
jgi:WhiB family redox-sensing transcriptional regulator